MKNYKIFLLAGFLVVLFNACIGFEQRDLFDDSSAIRLDNFLNDAKGILISAENGWVMDYFPTEKSCGYTFIMKFHPNSMVSIGSKSKDTGFRIDSCLFDVISGNGPILSFNTRSEYNDFHFFSDVDNVSSKEEIGDYEFIIIEFDKINKDKIKLKGSKKGCYIYMNRLNNDYNWKEYFDNIDAFHKLIFDNTTSTNSSAQGSWFIKLVSDKTIIEASNGLIHNFSFCEEGLDPVFNTEQVPFILYKDGLRFQHPYLVDGKVIQNFKISDDNNRLLCVDEGSTNIYFEGRNPINKLIEDKEKGNRNRWVFNYNSAPESLKILFDDVKETLHKNTGGAFNIINVQLFYEPKAKDYVICLSEGIIAEGMFYLESEIIENSISLKYTGRYDKTGESYIRWGQGTVNNLIEMLCKKYIVTPNPKSFLNLSTIEFTVENDTEFKFLLSL